jgi:hypothetical protein
MNVAPEIEVLDFKPTIFELGPSPFDDWEAFDCDVTASEACCCEKPRQILYTHPRVQFPVDHQDGAASGRDCEEYLQRAHHGEGRQGPTQAVGFRGLGKSVTEHRTGQEIVAWRIMRNPRKCCQPSRFPEL